MAIEACASPTPIILDQLNIFIEKCAAEGLYPREIDFQIIKRSLSDGDESPALVAPKKELQRRMSITECESPGTAERRARVVAQTANSLERVLNRRRVARKLVF